MDDTSRDAAEGVRYFRATAGYMAYCGTSCIQGCSVIHRIENSLFPEWKPEWKPACHARVEWHRPARTFEYTENTLRLIGDAGGLTRDLPWQRV